MTTRSSLTSTPIIFFSDDNSTTTNQSSLNDTHQSYPTRRDTTQSPPPISKKVKVSHHDTASIISNTNNSTSTDTNNKTSHMGALDILIQGLEYHKNRIMSLGDISNSSNTFKTRQGKTAKNTTVTSYVPTKQYKYPITTARPKLIGKTSRSIGVSDSQQALWLERYVELKQFKENHKRNPTKSQDGELGSWLSDQRRWLLKESDYLKTNPDLKEERITLLQSIDALSTRKVRPWDDNYSDLVNFVKEQNRLPSRGASGEELHLARFVMMQKMKLVQANYLQDPNLQYERLQKFLRLGIEMRGVKPLEESILKEAMSSSKK